MPSTEDRSKGIGGKGTAKAILTQGVARTDAPQGFKYRGRSDIAYDILGSFFDANNSGGPFQRSKTHIMYKAYLSYAQLKEYLSLLIENGLISYDSDTQHYNITDKGKEFVQIYERMAEHLSIDQQRGKLTPPRK